MFEPSLEKLAGTQDEPNEEISLEDTPLEELPLTPEEQAQEEWRILSEGDNQRLQERIRIATQSPDLPQAQAAIVNLARTASNELEALNGVTALTKKYDPLVLWVGLNRFNHYEDDEKSICHVIGKLLLEISPAFQEAKMNPAQDGELIATREDKKRRLEHNLEFLVNIPPDKRNEGYFHTIDFLEDIVGVINKYDHDLVQESVREFIKDPKHDEQACGMLLTLADLPRAERDDFLEHRRKELKIEDLTHSGERLVVRADKAGEKSPKTPEEEALGKEVSGIRPVARAEVSLPKETRRTSADIAKEIQAKYGHTVEALIDNPSLATWPKGEEPKLSQKVFGFFRKLAGGPPDPRVLNLIDDWKIAKLQEEKPASAEEMKARRTQSGYLAGRRALPDVSTTLNSMRSERRGALKTLGGYEQQETPTTTPEVLLEPAYNLLERINKRLIEIKKKKTVTTIEMSALKRAIDEAYNKLDEHRIALEKTPQFQDMLTAIEDAYYRYNTLDRAIQSSYTNEDREQEPERVKANQKNIPKVSVDELLEKEKTERTLTLIENGFAALQTLKDKNGQLSPQDLKDIKKFKALLDKVFLHLERLDLSLRNNGDYEALVQHAYKARGIYQEVLSEEPEKLKLKGKNSKTASTKRKAA